MSPLYVSLPLTLNQTDVSFQGKHLVNIFKDAKSAYNDKKAEIKADHRQRLEFRQAQKLLEAREESQSVASSHRSHRSHRSKSHRHKDRDGVSRPPLTERALSQIEEGSVAGSTRSQRSRSQHNGTRRSRPRDGYRSPYLEDAGPSNPHIVRRHTDSPQEIAHSDLPPPYSSQLTRRASNPEIRHDNIDMNLAYGTPPPELALSPAATERLREAELAATMSKLDTLLLEAQCLHHSATTIISNLQANPEAMAAVALTLAELSNLLSKMSPGIITALRSSSPAVFALLASPQFLIAGGVALGVTVVMFGGYKIVKKIQANNEAKKEANRMEEALVWDAHEMGSIESWRRGIAEVEAHSVATSVDGEFITPEATRQKKERIKERRREERASGWVGEERSTKTKRVGSVAGDSVTNEHIIKKKDVAPSESGRSERSSASKGKGKEMVVKEKEKKSKKSSAIGILFKKSKEKAKEKEKKGSSVSKTHRPKMIETS
jgi:hypothetical protein